MEKTKSSLTVTNWERARFYDLLEIMMNETTPFRRKLTHCFGAN
jgi:hypothetical protein